MTTTVLAEHFHGSRDEQYSLLWQKIWLNANKSLDERQHGIFHCIRYYINSSFRKGSTHRFVAYKRLVLVLRSCICTVPSCILTDTSLQQTATNLGAIHQFIAIIEKIAHEIRLTADSTMI